jgi:putative colanic acid biosynthesis UDP-glucose lipid carrier transferase
VGAGALGREGGEGAERGHFRGVDFLGYFDDRQTTGWIRPATTRLLGRLATWASYVRAQGMREVYITLPLGSQPRIVELLEKLQDTTASVFFVPDVFGISIIQGRLQDMNGVPVVGICETPVHRHQRADQARQRRRAGLADPGPDLAGAAGARHRRQAQFARAGDLQAAPHRPGWQGDPGLQVPLDDHARQRQRWCSRPRGRPAHHPLRRLHPQDLAGRTAAVHQRAAGPHEHRRPAAARRGAQREYRKLVKAYMVRHKVKPGITGWAQVNGLRGETDTVDKMAARVEYDLEYLRNWSLGLDLQIIVRTVRVMLFDRNAY